MIEWLTLEEERAIKKTERNQLYLVYRKGYPIVVADWKTGHGYRDIRTGESIDPELVARIELP